MIKIIHISDIHYSPQNADKSLASLEVSLKAGKEKGVDLWVLSGDLFDHSIKNTAASRFPELSDIIQQYLGVAPIVTVYGTITHDIPGCYDIFTRMKAKHNFTILQAGKAYHLMGKHKSKNLYLSGKDISDEYSTLLVLGCPEPQKSWFLRNKHMNQNEAIDAITLGMKEIFLGLGAIRKQYPDIPCIFVYHGAISGAKMCNGQLMKPGQIEIGRDDLAMVGADYIALGHIHLAQQIRGIEWANYAGSVAPWNWGELDWKSFFFVNMTKVNDAFVATIKRTPFPHPPMKKIVSDWSEADEPIADSHYDAFAVIQGFQIWQVYRATKEEKQEIDCDFILQKMFAWGALPGSKVTIEDIPEETVRTAEIRNAQTLLDKLYIYRSNSVKTSVDWASISSKAYKLKDEARQLGHNIDGAHWKLTAARIRGCIGIMKGQGKDEIYIDFTKYEPGIIALIDDNGRGKTAFLDNLQPYLCMMSRPGKLYEHFCLKDSCRELWYEDMLSGDRLRFLINIDGSSKPGKVESFIFLNDKPLVNGRIAGYEEKLHKLFGSQRLFTLSCFMPQFSTKKNPAIKDSTKGEKKKLFAELAGMIYQIYSANAKKRAEIFEKIIAENKIRLGMYKDIDKGTEDKKQEMEGALIQLEYKKKQLEKTIKVGKELGEMLETHEKHEAAKISVQDQIKDLRKFIVDKQNLISIMKEQAKPVICPECGFEIFEDRQKKLKKAIKENQEQIAKVNTQVKKFEAIEKELIINIDEYEKTVNPIDVKKEIEITRASYTDTKTEIATLEEKINNISEQIDNYEKQKQEAETLKKEIKKDTKEAIEWRYLQKATGPDGIQALELDALAPGICENINYFLPQDPAINRYTKARIDTTRIGGSGSKKKQIEDFKIIFLDSKYGDWVPFEILSGGEAVWARKAVHAAFSIIRSQQTGLRFLTACRDEVDGALDPSKKLAFTEMTQREHKATGVHQTIVITHSQEVQEAIGQFIRLSEL